MSTSATSPPTLDDRQFELAVRRLADALQYGSDASPFLGSGLDYAQSRRYEPGDSVRSIDWRLTARTGKPYVKEYEAPKQMATWLLVDDSGSMGVSSLRASGPSKWQWTTMLAGALGLTALRRSSPVGVMSATGLRRDPSLSRASLHGWLGPMRRRPAAGAASLGEVLRFAVPTLTNRANLIVLSDLHDPALLGAATLAAEKHDVIVLRLQDPAERGAIGGGIFRAEEAETGAGFVATGHSRFGLDTVPHDLRRAGIDHMDLPTDGHWVPALRQFLAGRARRAGRGR